MKYTIEGFSQRKVLSLRDEKQRVDCIDLVLLRWFIDFKDTPKMKYYDINGIRYYWVNYDKILSDLPILSISKRAVYDRFQKLVKFGVLVHYHVKEGGSFSYYGIGESYESLVSDSYHYEDNFKGGMKITSKGVGSQLPSKDYSITDYSITDSYSPYNPPKGEREESKRIESNSSKNDDYCNDVVSKFIYICSNLQKPQKLTPKRKHAILKAKKDIEEFGGWEKFFSCIASSRFLNGQNKHGWKADFDWILKPDNMVKIMEGNYQNNFLSKENEIPSEDDYDVNILFR